MNKTFFFQLMHRIMGVVVFRFLLDNTPCFRSTLLFLGPVSCVRKSWVDICTRFCDAAGGRTVTAICLIATLSAEYDQWQLKCILCTGWKGSYISYTIHINRVHILIFLILFLANPSLLKMLLLIAVNVNDHQ